MRTSQPMLRRLTSTKSGDVQIVLDDEHPCGSDPLAPLGVDRIRGIGQSKSRACLAPSSCSPISRGMVA
jgi:hypothetical protein